MVEFLFLDLDDTIFDFHKAEHIALSKTLEQFGLEPTEPVLNRYSQINLMHWQMLERGELTREQVLVQRFSVLFQELGITVDAPAVARTYEGLLGIGHYFLPGAEQAVKELSRNYRLFLASNGTARVQAGRLASSKISPYFEKIFISEEIGANKPDRAYFDRCCMEIPGYDAARALMVGDSLTSDILGGIRAGMRTCWVNPRHMAGRPDIVPDYEIEYLAQLPELLKTL